TLYFASDWAFKPLGVDEVKKRFENELTKCKLTAQHEWYPGEHVFAITCLRDEHRIYKLFHSVLRGIIVQEGGEDESADQDMEDDDLYDSDDDVNSKLIQSLTSWRRENHSREQRAIASDLSFPEEIQNYHIKDVWTYPEAYNVEFVTDDQLKDLEVLTSCKLMKEINKCSIFIGGNTSVSVHEVLRKLDNIKNLALMEPPYVNHIFYAEHVTNFQAMIKSFPDIRNGLFVRTTLLDPLDISELLNCPSLKKSQTIRCSVYNQVRGVHSLVVPPRTHHRPDEKPLETFDRQKEWIKMTYCPKGGPSDDPIKLFDGEEEPKPLSIPTAPKSVAFPDEVFMDGEPKNDEQVKDIQKWAENVPTPKTNIFTRPKPSNPEFDDDPESITNFLNPRGVSVTLLDDTIPFPSSSFPAIEPERKNLDLLLTYMSLANGGISDPYGSESQCPEAAGQLIDIQDDNNKGERVQQNDEVSTRSYQVVSNKKAAKNSANTKTPNVIFDPAPEFVKEVEKSFLFLIKGAEVFRGEIKLRAEFGRIILRKMPGTMIAEEGKVTSYHSDTVQQVLTQPKSTHDPREGPHVFFSNIITTVSTDAQYIVDMKDDNGKIMWEQKPTLPVQVVYEFRCVDTTTSPPTSFMVHIDAENFEARIETEFLFGEIFLHGTMRNWDVRISAEGHQSGKESYQEFGKGIKRSLYIQKDLSKPAVAFTTDLPSSITIASLRVRRTKTFNQANGTDTNSVQLNITEVLEMDVNYRPAPSQQLLVYKCEHNPDAILGGQTRWFEVRITSSVADQILKQNEDLELGDAAKWTRDDFIKAQVAKRLCEQTCKVLKKMDTVGLQNDNGEAPREAHSDQEPKKTKKEKKVYFWEKVNGVVSVR
ncbi:hypothetical protein F5884DRAFT_866066, partial [Xylogone sp. PMI_703]